MPARDEPDNNRITTNHYNWLNDKHSSGPGKESFGRTVQTGCKTKKSIHDFGWLGKTGHYGTCRDGTVLSNE